MFNKEKYSNPEKNLNSVNYYFHILFKFERYHLSDLNIIPF